MMNDGLTVCYMLAVIFLTDHSLPPSSPPSLGFVMFVLTLKKDYYQTQFGMVRDSRVRYT